MTTTTMELIPLLPENTSMRLTWQVIVSEARTMVTGLHRCGHPGEWWSTPGQRLTKAELVKARLWIRLTECPACRQRREQGGA